MDILQLYRGQDSHIGELEFHGPTLDEICNYGQLRFISMVSHICSIPTDYMSELDAKGIRYEDLDEYDFFVTSLWTSLSHEKVSIIFPNWYPENMDLGQRQKEFVRWDQKTNFVFDRQLYKEMTNTLRKFCSLKYAPRIAGNELTREKMIEIDRIKKRKKANQKGDDEYLLPLISSMVNCSEFKYNHAEVWQMPFFAFMDSVKRVQLNRTAKAMTTGGYFGVNLSEVSEYTDWMRSL